MIWVESTAGLSAPPQATLGVAEVALACTANSLIVTVLATTVSEKTNTTLPFRMFRSNDSKAGAVVSTV